MSYIQKHILKSHTKSEYAKLQSFDWKLIVLIAMLVKVDENYSYAERSKITNTFRNFFSVEQQSLALESIERIHIKTVDWGKFSTDLNAFTNLNDRKYLITFLFEIACADSVLKDVELDFIHRMSLAFEIAEDEFFEILKKYKLWNKTFRIKKMERLVKEMQDKNLTQVKVALSIMQLNDIVSLKELKQRYRELMKTHHPDVVIHLPEKEQGFHKEQVYKINIAYEYLLKTIG